MPIAVTPAGIDVISKEEHSRKVSWLIVVIPDGRLVSARLVQSENAPLPSSVRLDGREVNASEVQPLNACVPMLVTPDGRLVSARFVQ